MTKIRTQWAEYCVLLVFGLICVSLTGNAEEHAFNVRDSISLTTFNVPSGLRSGDQAPSSPDGKYLWIITTRGNVESNQIESTLWLIDRAAVQDYLRSNGPETAHAPALMSVARIVAVPGILVQEPYAALITDVRWSRDSKTLYFLGQNSHSEKQLYKVDIQTGRLSSLTQPGYGIRQFDLAEDKIAYTAIQSDASKNRNAWDAAAGINADAGSVTGLGLEDILFGGTGHGFGSGQVVPDLWIGSGMRFRQVSDPITRQPMQDAEHYDNVLSLSPDGRFVVRLLPVQTAEKSWSLYEPKPGFESWRIRSNDPALTSPANWFRLREYEMVDTATGQARPLIDGPNGYSLAEEDKSLAVWSKNGARLLIGNVALPLEGVGRDEQIIRRHVCAAAVVDVASLNAECIVYTRDASDVIPADNPKPERLQDASFGSTTDEVVLRFSWHGRWGQTEHYRYADGKWKLTATLPGDAVTGGSPASAEGQETARESDVLVTVKQDLNEPPKLWATDQVSQSSKLLWDPNPQLGAMSVGRASLYHWKDASGYEWTGILVMPPDYVRGHRCPLVIQTHGFSSDVFITDGSYPTAMAARPLASVGIAVLQMAWRADHFGTYQEASDQVSGFEAAIAHLSAGGMIDPSRVGVIGFSRSCWHVEEALIDHPNLFAAATIVDGMDLSYMQYTLFGEGRPSLQKEYAAMIGSSPDGEGLNAWTRQSPSFRLGPVTTPLRIEAIGPASVLMEWEIYASLRRQDKPVDMIYIPGGQHILQKPLDRLASQQGNVDWFRFWLQGIEDPDKGKVEQYRRWRNLRDNGSLQLK